MAFRVLAFYGAGFESLKYRDLASLMQAFRFRAGRLGFEGLASAACTPKNGLYIKTTETIQMTVLRPQNPHDLGPWTSRSRLNPKP